METWHYYIPRTIRYISYISTPLILGCQGLVCISFTQIQYTIKLCILCRAFIIIGMLIPVYIIHASVSAHSYDMYSALCMYCTHIVHSYSDPWIDLLCTSERFGNVTLTMRYSSESVHISKTHGAFTQLSVGNVHIPSRCTMVCATLSTQSPVLNGMCKSIVFIYIRFNTYQYVCTTHAIYLQYTPRWTQITFLWPYSNFRIFTLHLALFTTRCHP